MTSSASMRLHITPLTPELLPLVLGAGLAKSADNISYHGLETFPENNYGFVDLPEADATKLVSKLNGAILRGRRMKIEEARPEKRTRAAENGDGHGVAEKPRKKSKQAAKEKDVIDGHELGDGRKVKRGWTESKADKAVSKTSKDKKRKTKSHAPSKYTEKEELLFRTKVPENKADLASPRDRGPKKKGSKDVVVHEFANRETQPSFLRDNPTSSRPAAEYIEGTGWVDDRGQVVEEEPKHRASRRNQASTPRGLMISIPQSPSANVTELRASSKTGEDSPEALSPADAPAAKALLGADKAGEDDTSSSGASSSESGNHEDEAQSPVTALVQDNEDKQIRNGDVSEPETPPKVHPLEVLFKKPKQPDNQASAKPSLEVETSFSFFGQGSTESDDELPPMPVTPFTSQELYSRRMRSAAPTPDTAHPSRFTNFAEAIAARIGERSEEEAGDDSLPDAVEPSTEQSAPKAESEFEKRFWQERGANNRAWKASRRAALKDRRQKQNRSRSSRKWK